MQYRDPSPVRIVIYASRSNIIGPVFGQMASIRSVVARRNISLGLGTALLHQSGWFVQWVEGPTQAVQQVLDRIARDPRHGAMHIVIDDEAPRQLHGSWSMAVVQAEETPEDFGRRVAALLREREQGLRHAPAAAWRLLSTPLGHVGSQAQADPSLFCRTLVCAADFDESFELVRWLGQQQQAEVVRRRFAGEDTPDVATDYVDFADDGRVHRVIAMARNGMGIGLTRAFLADYGCIVLLRGSDVRRDLQVLELLTRACDGLLHRPVLLGVGTDASGHEEMRGVARARGMYYLNADVQDRRDCDQLWQAIVPVVREFAAPMPVRSQEPVRAQACRPH